MFFDVLGLTLGGYIVAALVLTHITIASVTIYLHRHQAHRALDLHPIVSHFFRLWLWLTTGQVTKEWVSVHRKHHAKVETSEDPHSPQIWGIRKVLLEGAELYRMETVKKETLEKYGHGTPDDWMERVLYGCHSFAGVALMFVIDLVLFGFAGIVIWAVQMAWIPFMAAGVINGLGHWSGYRNYETRDASTNIVPIGVIIGGEELHNNHHAFASSARFSSRWWEFDIGWLYIKCLSALGLARIKKVAPRPVMIPGKASPDVDTVTAIITNRMQVMAHYAKNVLNRVHEEELRKADASHRSVIRRARSLLIREESRLSAEARRKLESALDYSHTLQTVYEYKRRLQALWMERTASQERLLVALQEWCKQAEETGIRALQDFARTLPTYSVRPA